MLRHKEDCRYQVIEKMKGGDGHFCLRHIGENSEMAGQASLFARGSLPPGSTVGLHKHKGNMEYCLFLGGEGLVREEQAEYSVKAGDVSICFDGGSHEIINTGALDLEYIVLVLKTDGEFEKGD